MTKLKQFYWLSDAEWFAIEPHLPKGRSGAHRVDNRRVISGIVHMLRSGARWRDWPTEYGPYTTVCNRFNRWSRQGGWSGIFCALTGKSDVVTGAVDATYVKTHRSAAGAKGGLRQRHRSLTSGRTTKIHALTDEFGRLINPASPESTVIAPAQLQHGVGHDRIEVGTSSVLKGARRCAA